MQKHITWSPLAQFLHPATITGPPSVVAYSEIEEDTGRRIVIEAVSGGSQACMGGWMMATAAAARCRS